MKYTRRQPEIIEAFQWWKNGDHPDDGPRDREGAIIRYYRHPAKPGEEVHRRCGHRWHDHGYMEAWYVYGRNAYDVGEPVCPSDYIIIMENPGNVRFKKHRIASADSFARVYQSIGPVQPLTLSQTQYERMKPDLTSLPDGGILVIPDELYKEHIENVHRNI